MNSSEHPSFNTLKTDQTLVNSHPTSSKNLCNAFVPMSFVTEIKELIALGIDPNEAGRLVDAERERKARAQGKRLIAPLFVHLFVSA